MMVWISRLTLIAYLVGGWLLPAAHFHAHSVAAKCPEAAQSAHQHSHQHSHPHGCDHSHAKTVANASSTAEGFSQRDGSTHSHNGLCSVCAARTLASTAQQGLGTSIVRVAPQLSSPTATEKLCFSAILGAHSSRGPPENA